MSLLMSETQSALFSVVMLIGAMNRWLMLGITANPLNT